MPGHRPTTPHPAPLYRRRPASSRPVVRRAATTPLVRTLEHPLLKVLSLPVLTVVAYGIAYGIALAYEWGIFDAFGAPHELVKVEVGQLALPAFVCVLVALSVGGILYLAVVCLHSSNHLVWRLVFLLAAGRSVGVIWGSWGLVLLGLVVLLWNAVPARTHGVWWHSASLLYATVTFAAWPNPPTWAPEAFWLIGGGLIGLLLSDVARFVRQRLQDGRHVPSVGRLLLRFDDALKAASLPVIPRFGQVLWAILLILTVLSGLVLGSYRLGKAHAQVSIVPIVQLPDGNTGAVVRVYNDRVIEGFVDPKTSCLTGRWQVVKYPDAHPFTVSVKDVRLSKPDPSCSIGADPIAS
jgi:hypothetical protein